MTPEFQTIAALVVVAIAATWLALRARAKRRNPGCGDNCGAVSRDVKALQARIKRRK